MKVKFGDSVVFALLGILWAQLMFLGVLLSLGLRLIGDEICSLRPGLRFTLMI